MRQAIREINTKVSVTQKVSLMFNNRHTLGSYRGLNQSEIVKGGPLQDSSIIEFIAKSSKLCYFPNCCRFSTDFVLRRVLWRHRNAHSVKERLFLSSKNGINNFVFSSCPIYKSSFVRRASDKRSESRKKSALPVWAVRRRPFISSDRSRGLLSITRHHYTPQWEIQWRK